MRSTCGLRRSFVARASALLRSALVSSVGGSRPSEEEAAETYQVQGEPQNGPTEVPLPCGLDLVWAASSCADTDQGPVSDLADLDAIWEA